MARMRPRRKFGRASTATSAAARAIRISSKPLRSAPRAWAVEESTPMNAARESLIGRSVERREDYRFLTGVGQYTDDIKLERQSYAYFVRSPHAHARIRAIDAKAALAAAGVLAIFT